MRRGLAPSFSTNATIGNVSVRVHLALIQDLLLSGAVWRTGRLVLAAWGLSLTLALERVFQIDWAVVLA